MAEVKKFYTGIDLQDTSKVVNVPTPTADGDAANKLYVDNAVSGVTGQLSYQGVLDASTYTNELDNQNAGDYFVVSVAGTVEGVEVAVGDILLLNADTTEATSSDFDKIDNTDLSETDVKALFSAGTGLSYANGVFSITNLGVDTAQLANDAVDKTKINADVAGIGLGQNVDGSLEVNVDDSTVEVSADTLQVKDGGIAEAKLADNAVTNAKMADNSVGTAEIIDGNVTEAKLSSALQNKLNGTYKETFGDGVEIVNTITHGLETKDVDTQVYDITTGACIECDVVRNTVNTVLVTANPPIASNNARILIKRID